MVQLKNFIQEGNIYKLKPQYGLFIPLFLIFVALGVLTTIKSPGSNIKWIFYGIALLGILAFFKQHFTIDLNKKEMQAKMGLFGGGQSIPLSDLQGFTIHKLKQMGFITTNVTLIANYTKNGKNKQMRITQSFFTKPIQSILNDIDEILAQNDKNAI